MKTIDVEFLKRLQDSWFSTWAGNIQTAIKQKLFVTLGRHYTDKEIKRYKQNNTEPIVWNATKIKSNNLLNAVRGKRFDLELKTNGALNEEDMQMVNILNDNLTNLIFSTDASLEYQKVLRNAIVCGYGALYIGFGYNNEDYEDPKFSIKIRSLNEHESFFFDPAAETDHKGDGRFCGVTHKLYKSNMNAYKKDFDKLSFQDTETIPYIEVTDLYLRHDDGDIYFYRFTDDLILERKLLQNVLHLPMVFHGGCSEFINGEEVTMPPSIDAYDAQRMLNRALSMMDLATRNYVMRFLVPVASVPPELQDNYANRSEIVLQYIPTENPPQVLPPVSADPNLIFSVQNSVATISEIYSDLDSIIGDSKYSSGKAIDKKLSNSKQGGVSAFYTGHRVFLNRVGTIELALLPYQITNDGDIQDRLLELGQRANVAIKMSESLEQQKERNNELLSSMMQYMNATGLASPQISLELMMQMLNNTEIVEMKNLSQRLALLGQQQQQQQQEQQQKPNSDEVKMMEIQVKQLIEEMKVQNSMRQDDQELLRELIRNQHEEKMAKAKINEVKNI